MDLNDINYLDQIVLPPRARVSERALSLMKADGAGGVRPETATAAFLVAIMELEVRVMELEGDTTVRQEWSDLIE